MRKLEVLRKNARLIAKLRGHSLGRFAFLGGMGAARCSTCLQRVVIESQSRPPDVPALSGAALAVNCRVGAWSLSFDLIAHEWVARNWPRDSSIVARHASASRAALIRFLNGLEG